MYTEYTMYTKYTVYCSILCILNIQYIIYTKYKVYCIIVHTVSTAINPESFYKTRSGDLRILLELKIHDPLVQITTLPYFQVIPW